jgi:hypothetical protein
MQNSLFLPHLPYLPHLNEASLCSACSIISCSVDIIKSAGYKISALMIESVIMEHPGRYPGVPDPVVYRIRNHYHVHS